MSGLAVGIDLGTTNSCVAIWQEGTARALTSQHNQVVTPSVVWIHAQGRRQVGLLALNQIPLDGENVATEFKRLMGSAEVIEFPASGAALKPEELSAEVLKSLREDIRRHTGESAASAVITVPAAFGTLQCEATREAAKLAGFTSCRLLQEPIAAAIAYGAEPGAESKRWMVFDLGGGTLDVAIVSTRDGRLSVIEHMGDNRLGGKDIDTALVHEVILPLLRRRFVLPDPREQPDAHAGLLRRLRLDAEREKIALSREAEVEAWLQTSPRDASGQVMDVTFPLTRTDLLDLAAPSVARAIRLAKEALARARLRASDLDEILLVGGPTQAPYVREALAEAFGVPLRFDVDPMTVVALGAARFAGLRPDPSPGAHAPGPRGRRDEAVSLRLAHDTSSKAALVGVTGVAEDERPAEVCIDRADGGWSSGWAPIHDGLFEVDVALAPGQANEFRVRLRDATGRELAADPDSFVIESGLTLDAPPLPHSISAEVITSGSEGRSELEPLFSRHARLPTRVTKRFRSAHDLEPGNPKAALHIKFWEGEHFHDAAANQYLGRVELTGASLPRALPAGSELELTVVIDASRCIRVEVFVPSMNLHAGFDFFAQRGTVSDGVVDLQQIREQMSEQWRRLDHLAKEHFDPDVREEIEDRFAEMRELAREVGRAEEAEPALDPDELHRLAGRARDLQGRIGALERRLGIDPVVDAALGELAMRLRDAMAVVEYLGNAADKLELESLTRRCDAAREAAEPQQIQELCRALGELAFRVRARTPEYWAAFGEHLWGRRSAMTDHAEADRLFATLKVEAQRRNVPAMQYTVRSLRALLPRDAEAEVHEMQMRSGLRRF